MNNASQLPLPSIGKPPSFLLEPFKWAIPNVIAMLRAQPSYLTDLIHLSQARMHLIGIALAHLEAIPHASLIEILFRGSAGMILDGSVGQRPHGLKRAVRLMPAFMMKAESYRTLIKLLSEPQAAQLLHHASEIRDSTIKTMNDVPPLLRAALLSLHENIGDMSSFSEGLRCIALRGGDMTFDQLVSELARARQPSQLLAKLRSIIDKLPLPDVLPPAHVQHAKRIDSGRQLRDLGKKWGNCLGNYAWNVENGQCAIYLWQRAGVQAACSVARSGRLGWFLDEVKGPENTDIERSELDKIQNAFEAAGMPSESVIQSIAQIVASDDLSIIPRRRRRRARAAPPPDEVMLPDLA
ncbi:hypothetical protein [Bradyrhizobium betae]|uniref:Uncharacterized protein n=1 Tax=Bradyrhizobium betae TaxID=244734 RepID=A0A5P6P6Y3_9BRAD|nr:hypothetical protein [Bradyrhizobium betae]MCS3731372.1 hypothetical protein [Bradyrhizobium betae]QFI73965.1 hypothetical protein F8237_17050 [Bradyrhizobium betae]